MKVLFLDIDGVLNSENTTWKNDSELWSDDDLEPTLIDHLNQIIDATEAEIVISSSWRLMHSQEKIVEMLENKGFHGHVIDMTPRLDRTPEGKIQDRGDEINKWLTEHPETKSFVVVDDFAYQNFEKWFPWRFVQTDYKIGLSTEDVKQCVLILNFPNSNDTT